MPSVQPYNEGKSQKEAPLLIAFIYCPNCQTTHPVDTNYCPICGASLEEAPLIRASNANLPYCDKCRRRALTFPIEFNSNIGLLLLRYNKYIAGHLCYSCIRSAYHDHLITNLLLGWWGIKSFFYTISYLIDNERQYRQATRFFRSLTS